MDKSESYYNFRPFGFEVFLWSVFWVTGKGVVLRALLLSSELKQWHFFLFSLEWKLRYHSFSMKPTSDFLLKYFNVDLSLFVLG